MMPFLSIQFRKFLTPERLRARLALLEPLMAFLLIQLRKSVMRISAMSAMEGAFALWSRMKVMKWLTSAV